MLNGIPKIIPPELLKILCEMGHGERIVIGDANFPVCTVAGGKPIVRMDGIGGSDVLRAVLQLIPLDGYVDDPVIMMQPVPGDSAPAVWDEYFAVFAASDPRGKSAVRFADRFSFYDEAAKAYAFIQTGEGAPYANILLQKGVIK